MTTEEKILTFMRRKIKEWGPNPLNYVRTKGVIGLAAEFAQEPDLSQFCGWMQPASHDEIVGAATQFIREENPALGDAMSIIVNALIDACVQRHELNKAAADRNIVVGSAGMLGLTLLIAGIALLDNTDES